jgi:L-ascorbate metabolism protein UlaG (beta-lactamase superfamily)
MSSSCLVFKFHGHACVSAHYKDLTIVVDPHDGASLGLSPPAVKGDLVLVTHDHFDHNAVNVVSKPDSVVLESFVGEKRLSVRNIDVNVLGVRVPHDKQSGKRRGWVSAYRVSIGEFSYIHLGDIGDYPSEDALLKLSQPRPDVLFIPVGGFYTIEPYEAWDIASKINPRFIVPIHYWVRGLNLPIKPVNDFLLAAKTGKEEKEFLEICGKEAMAEKPKIILLKSP